MLQHSISACQDRSNTADAAADTGKTVDAAGAADTGKTSDAEGKAGAEEESTGRNSWTYLVKAVPVDVPGTDTPAVYSATETVPDYYKADAETVVEVKETKAEDGTADGVMSGTATEDSSDAGFADDVNDGADTAADAAKSTDATDGTDAASGTSAASGTDAEAGADGTIIFNDRLMYGGISFTKKVTPYETSSANKGRELPLEGAEFTATLIRRGGLYDTVPEKKVVFTAKSDKDGSVVFADIPVGEYMVEETSAPKNVIVKDTVYEADVAEGQESPLNVSAGAGSSGRKALKENTVVDDVARIDIGLKKVAEDDGGETVPGAVYGLYRKIDEADAADYSAVKEADGSLWGLVAKKTTSEDGTLKFEGVVMDVTYRIYEESAPDGWYLSEYPAEFMFSLDDEGNVMRKPFDSGHGTAEAVGTADLVFRDAPVIVTVSKLTPAGKRLKGASLRIREKESGKVVCEWTSSRKKETFRARLTAGRTYVLEETKAPYGYRKAKKVEFTVPADAVSPGESKVVEVEMTDPIDPDVADANRDKANGDGAGSGNGSNGSGSGSGVKTGDDTPVNVWFMLMLASLALIGLGLEERKKRRGRQQ